MPRFYFHLATPEGCERDEIGSELTGAEAAYLEARKAALEICGDIISQGGSPAGYRFEIRDSAGRLVQDLSFREVLTAPLMTPVQDTDVARTRLAASLARSRELQAELAAGFAEAYATLATTRALLKRRS
jgi:hypothetical protein